MAAKPQAPVAGCLLWVGDGCRILPAMTRFYAIFSCLALWLAISLPAQSDITVFAAASLREVLQEIATDYESDVTLSFSGSGTIARQAAAGAPVDVVVLASTDWMTWLRDQAPIAPAHLHKIAANRMVLIAAPDASSLNALDTLPEAIGEGRLAMGHRAGVPAGVYARQWLTEAGLWEQLNTQLAETDNVRAALVLVARGETPFGIVYATDARAASALRVLATAPMNAHDPILYWAAALTPDGAAFADHLISDTAAARFAAQGFAAVPE